MKPALMKPALAEEKIIKDFRRRGAGDFRIMAGEGEIGRSAGIVRLAVGRVGGVEIYATIPGGGQS